MTPLIIAHYTPPLTLDPIYVPQRGALHFAVKTAGCIYYGILTHPTHCTQYAISTEQYSEEKFNFGGNISTQDPS
jgi:hypothetical protein